MRMQRYDPWDRKLKRWLFSLEWEVVALYFFIFFMGFCAGAFAVMIQYQHQIIALLGDLP